MSMNNYYGLNAENYFLSRMNSLGLKTSHDDSWYDFLVNNKKVEVKSCSLFIKQKKLKKSSQVKTKKSQQVATKGNKKQIHYRSGRFHFTEPKNRENQFKENIWVCFIVRHNEDFMILGFLKAKDLKKKPEVTLSQLGKYKLINMDKWLLQVNRKSCRKQQLRKKPVKKKVIKKKKGGEYK